jgi:hypothetical protein
MLSLSKPVKIEVKRVHRIGQLGKENFGFGNNARHPEKKQRDHRGCKEQVDADGPKMPVHTQPPFEPEDSVVEDVAEDEGEKEKTEDLAHQKEQAEERNPDDEFFVGSEKLVQIERHVCAKP